MLLTRYTYKNIPENAAVSLPCQDVFDLPEKVLQFGTGVLLRGLPDYFIDQANKQGIFNGRIVVIKSTDSGSSADFDNQDDLYTICVRGIENGEKIEQNIINASISRVVSAKTEWGKVLQCAHNPELKLIISNTTEVGISFVKDDIWTSPPVSFPGKLLSFLYERFKAFAGSAESGMVIVPTELIMDNGRKLESIVLELAHVNGLEETFMDWLENSNYFCNSLVDRIVPGKPGTSEKQALEKVLAYEDDLLIVAEAYRLWAIESDSDHVKNVLSFYKVDDGVKISADITKHRELKLRLLNGTHTLSCGLALLARCVTVKDAMEDLRITGYMKELMMNEIAPAITGPAISKEEALRFASQVLDRFRNPFLDHKWMSISVQYSSKIKMRILPLVYQFYERFHTVPECIALGFSAYLLFMKPAAGVSNPVTDHMVGSAFSVQDDSAGYFSERWKHTPDEEYVESVLGDESLWGSDLTDLEGFSASVTSGLKLLMKDGAGAIQKMLTAKTVVQS